ncbi:glycosyltransferase family 2 protein [Flavobacterium soyangense]|uniref:Glycosyltransferase family 2 protein n=1 Tax=Flavobacterium soyangense TaxID=2023265 RepID=A0A930UB82_9FLAO|nr:glycosyltransferase family A protein [Flavobacterium soyangense]MBF2708249.1 glycosyltransferase family 2 protein [Flavobacterium soyangense]
MILLYHNGDTIVELANASDFSMEKHHNLSIAAVLVAVAKAYPEEILIWCHQSLNEQLNSSAIETLFHHKKLMLSYNPSHTNFIDQNIGYIDASPFILINKAVTFATWQMSSWVGGIHAEVLLAFNGKIPFDKDFDYFLCSLAKLGMQRGLLCYSEPLLFKQKKDSSLTKPSNYTLFRFVKQHYRTRWVFLLFFNLAVYERKTPFLPFLFSLFYKNRTKASINLDTIRMQSSRKIIDKATLDVIIPTIGRKEYLYDVLSDLKSQSHLPTNVIIVEQNPDEGSQSELDYLTNQEWPFKIKHIFTHQAGACNARNVALKQITSEWVFFADDDIQIEVDFIEKALEEIAVFGVKAVSVQCFQKGNSKKGGVVFQWITFGAGCSFVFADSIKQSNFNRGYEFGFGEDGDFGMQLRNQGTDVLYLPDPAILHLKAPIGGFRTKPLLQWQNGSIQPKPSPTIMLFQISHHLPEQIRGYKTILFFKYYAIQCIKNPILYYIHFQKQWKQSVFWANKLKQQNEV